MPPESCRESRQDLASAAPVFSAERFAEGLIFMLNSMYRPRRAMPARLQPKVYAVQGIWVAGLSHYRDLRLGAENRKSGKGIEEK
jgi:hypothetical protein